MRFQSNSGTLKCCRYFIMICDFEERRISIKVLSLVRHRVTRRLTWFQTIIILLYIRRSSISQNVLKRFVAVAARLRLFFQCNKVSTVTGEKKSLIYQNDL